MIVLKLVYSLLLIKTGQMWYIQYFKQNGRAAYQQLQLRSCIVYEWQWQ